MSDRVITLPVADVEFVKELYPRLREDDAVIERYRAAIDRLPPIIVARGRVLVDGFHRWQAYRREAVETIEAIDLGNLADIEILKESIRRNAQHGHQLETRDKRRMADQLYRQGVRDTAELVELLSLTPDSLETYLREARADEKAAQQAKAWDLWLDCLSEREIERHVGLDHSTISRLVLQKRNDPELQQPPESRQDFTIWRTFEMPDSAKTSYFGQLPPQVIENVLWLYTEPGQIVVDPFVGSGTTIDVCKRMGRRIWASDRKPSTPLLPIHAHDIVTSWPPGAPRKAHLIFLDPPYWRQAAGRYSDDADDLGNMDLDGFRRAWADVVALAAGHLEPKGHLAFIVSPSQLPDDEGGEIVHHDREMTDAGLAVGLTFRHRFIVPYSTEQWSAPQLLQSREKRRPLPLHRDLVVLWRS